ncbi:hypothetical protein [Kitasatospora sp. NPDC088134]|uniref:hypothetical protein n=1 Tax=Kitasatospora sp. NPDC088134 TaxID=3364071 RepID=UPI003802B200
MIRQNARSIPVGSEDDVVIRPDRGATGFRDRRDEALPTTDPAAFRGACFAAMPGGRSRPGRVVPADGCTFHLLPLPDGGGPPGLRSALCHAHLPLVAFTGVRPEPGSPPSGFLDPPLPADVFPAHGLRVLTTIELATPVEHLDLHGLAAAERDQIRYWRPRNYGELLFNWWD